MLKTAIIIVLVVIVVIIIGLVLYKINNKHDYFMIKDDDRKAVLDFYIKKHTIFRLSLLIYSTIHYLLNIISIVFSMVTVYMILDKSINSKLQAVFLLIAAIFTNLSINLRLDRMAEGYAEAMRIMEYAILNYIRTGTDSQSLCEANKKAEECIGNKFI